MLEYLRQPNPTDGCKCRRNQTAKPTSTPRESTAHTVYWASLYLCIYNLLIISYIISDGYKCIYTCNIIFRCNTNYILSVSSNRFQLGFVSACHSFSPRWNPRPHWAPGGFMTIRRFPVMGVPQKTRMILGILPWIGILETSNDSNCWLKNGPN